jgi:predicted transcriptional regulator
MKAVTIHVDEPVYDQYKQWARASSRSTSELIREAMAYYRSHSPSSEKSLQEPEAPASVGKILHSWTGREDLLDDFLSRS